MRTYLLPLLLGVAGAALVELPLLFGLPNRVVPALLPTSREVVRVVSEEEFAVSEAAQSLVTFLAASTEAAFAAPEEARAIGFALTSDGLIATAADFTSLKGMVATSFEREPFSVSFAKGKNGKTFFDKESRLVFLTIAEAEQRRPNLKPLALASSEDLRPGQRVFSFAPNGSLAFHLIVEVGDLRAPAIPFSSEGIPTLWRVDGELQAGALIFNAQGQLLGVAQSGGRVFPAEFISNLLRDYLKEGQRVKTKLGIHFLDLSQLIVLKEGLPKSGLLLAPSSAHQAVAPGSPAAGLLREGDVLTSFEGRSFNNAIPLPLLLQRYRPETEVELGILRNGKEEKVKIVLGKE